MKQLIRITTVPLSLDKLLEGQLRWMGNHFQVTAISSDAGYLKRIGEREGVATHVLEMTRKITPFRDVWAVFQLTLYLLKNKPDLVHTHTPKAGIIGMLAAKLAGVPLRLHTVAGLPLMEAGGWKRKLLDFVEQLTYACATGVYPNSKGLEAFIVANRYTKKEKVKVIAHGSTNGINTTYFNPEHYSLLQKQAIRNDLGIQENDFVFVFVGRLVGDKGINELVEAFTQLPTPHSKLLLVGPYETELDPLHPTTLAAIETHPHIISVGFQADVRPYYALSDCLVFPSYREGFPNVVLQAGAMGLPSIVTDINGCNEIITEGINGTIIPPKDSAALQQAMTKMVADAVWRCSLQQNARTSITSRYEQEVVWEALLAEYQRLLAISGTT